jgi:Flp pilus assembly protein TadD
MSLINQMLRDLEQRNNQQQEPDLDQAIRKVGLRPSKKRHILWLTPVIVLFSIFVWRQYFQEQTSQQALVVTSPGEDSVQKTSIAIIQPPVVVQATQPGSAKVLNPRLPEIKRKIAEKPKLLTVKPETKPATKKSEKIKPELQLSVTTRRSEQLASLYRQAQRSDSALLAREALEQALQLDPFYLPARTLLLQNLLKSPASDFELSVLVDSSLALFPDNLLFIKTRAHLYIKDKNFIAAANVLRSIDASTIKDTAYLALLAACYQQLQNFSQAAPIYRRLTEMQPEKAENWLGLAICADRLNQFSLAAEAYRQALDKNTLHNEVVNYINQRLSLLN